MKDNKLISKFMGCEISRTNNKSRDYIYGFWINGVQISLENLQYHSSWDWLMPVVEKIESLDYRMKIFRQCCEIVSLNNEGFYIGETESSKISSTYKAVIKFIKWYNKNTP